MIYGYYHHLIYINNKKYMVLKFFKVYSIKKKILSNKSICYVQIQISNCLQTV